MGKSYINKESEEGLFCENNEELCSKNHEIGEEEKEKVEKFTKRKKNGSSKKEASGKKLTDEENEILIRTKRRIEILAREIETDRHWLSDYGDLTGKALSITSFWTDANIHLNIKQTHLNHTYDYNPDGKMNIKLTGNGYHYDPILNGNREQVPGDGNCFFYSIYYLLKHDETLSDAKIKLIPVEISTKEEFSLFLRKRISEYIRRNPELYIEVVDYLIDDLIQEEGGGKIDISDVDNAIENNDNMDRVAVALYEKSVNEKRANSTGASASKEAHNIIEGNNVFCTSDSVINAETHEKGGREEQELGCNALCSLLLDLLSTILWNKMVDYFSKLSQGEKNIKNTAEALTDIYSEIEEVYNSNLSVLEKIKKISGLLYRIPASSGVKGIDSLREWIDTVGALYSLKTLDNKLGVIGNIERAIATISDVIDRPGMSYFLSVESKKNILGHIKPISDILSLIKPFSSLSADASFVDYLRVGYESAPVRTMLPAGIDNLVSFADKVHKMLNSAATILHDAKRFSGVASSYPLSGDAYEKINWLISVISDDDIMLLLDRYFPEESTSILRPHHEMMCILKKYPSEASYPKQFSWLLENGKSLNIEGTPLHPVMDALSGVMRKNEALWRYIEIYMRAYDPKVSWTKFLSSLIMPALDIAKLFSDYMPAPAGITIQATSSVVELYKDIPPDLSWAQTSQWIITETSTRHQNIIQKAAQSAVSGSGLEIISGIIGTAINLYSTYNKDRSWDQTVEWLIKELTKNTDYEYIYKGYLKSCLVWKIAKLFSTNDFDDEQYKKLRDLSKTVRKIDPKIASILDKFIEFMPMIPLLNEMRKNARAKPKETTWITWLNDSARQLKNNKDANVVKSCQYIRSLMETWLSDTVIKSMEQVSTAKIEDMFKEARPVSGGAHPIGDAALKVSSTFNSNNIMNAVMSSPGKMMDFTGYHLVPRVSMIVDKMLARTFFHGPGEEEPLYAEKEEIIWGDEYDRMKIIAAGTGLTLMWGLFFFCLYKAISGSRRSDLKKNTALPLNSENVDTHIPLNNIDSTEGTKEVILPMVEEEERMLSSTTADNEKNTNSPGLISKLINGLSENKWILMSGISGLLAAGLSFSFYRYLTRDEVYDLDDVIEHVSFDEDFGLLSGYIDGEYHTRMILEDGNILTDIEFKDLIESIGNDIPIHFELRYFYFSLMDKISYNARAWERQTGNKMTKERLLACISTMIVSIQLYIVIEEIKAKLNHKNIPLLIKLNTLKNYLDKELLDSHLSTYENYIKLINENKKFRKLVEFWDSGFRIALLRYSLHKASFDDSKVNEYISIVDKYIKDPTGYFYYDKEKNVIGLSSDINVLQGVLSSLNKECDYYLKEEERISNALESTKGVSVITVHNPSAEAKFDGFKKEKDEELKVISSNIEKIKIFKIVVSTYINYSMKKREGLELYFPSSIDDFILNAYVSDRIREILSEDASQSDEKKKEFIDGSYEVEYKLSGNVISEKFTVFQIACNIHIGDKHKNTSYDNINVKWGKDFENIGHKIEEIYDHKKAFLEIIKRSNEISNALEYMEKNRVKSLYEFAEDHISPIVKENRTSRKNDPKSVLDIKIERNVLEKRVCPINPLGRPLSCDGAGEYNATYTYKFSIFEIAMDYDNLILFSTKGIDREFDYSPKAGRKIFGLRRHNNFDNSKNDKHFHYEYQSDECVCPEVKKDLILISKLKKINISEKYVKYIETCKNDKKLDTSLNLVFETITKPLFLNKKVIVKEIMLNGEYIPGMLAVAETENIFKDEKNENAKDASLDNKSPHVYIISLFMDKVWGFNNFADFKLAMKNNKDKISEHFRYFTSLTGKLPDNLSNITFNDISGDDITGKVLNDFYSKLRNDLEVLKKALSDLEPTGLTWEAVVELLKIYASAIVAIASLPLGMLPGLALSLVVSVGIPLTEALVVDDPDKKRRFLLEAAFGGAFDIAFAGLSVGASAALRALKSSRSTQVFFNRLVRRAEGEVPIKNSDSDVGISALLREGKTLKETTDITYALEPVRSSTVIDKEIKLFDDLFKADDILINAIEKLDSEAAVTRLHQLFVSKQILSSKFQGIETLLAGFNAKDYKFNFTLRSIKMWNQEGINNPTIHYVGVVDMNGTRYVLDPTIKKITKLNAKGPLVSREVEWMKTYENGLKERALVKFIDTDLLSDAEEYAQAPVRSFIHRKGEFLLTRPTWYEGAIETPFTPALEDTTYYTISKIRAKVRELIYSDKSQYPTNKSFFDFVIDAAQGGELISEGGANTLRIEARNLSHNVDNLDGFFHAPRKITTYEEMNNIIEGEVVAFVSASSDTKNLSHLVLSMGDGRFSGVKNDFLNPALGPGKMTIVTEEIGVFKDNKFISRDMLNQSSKQGEAAGAPELGVEIEVYAGRLKNGDILPSERPIMKNRRTQLLGPQSEFTPIIKGGQKNTTLRVKAHGLESNINHLDAVEFSHVIRGLCLNEPGGFSLEQVNQIELIVCYSADGGKYSSAQVLADQLGIEVIGYEGRITKMEANTEGGLRKTFTPRRDGKAAAAALKKHLVKFHETDTGTATASGHVLYQAADAPSLQTHKPKTLIEYFFSVLFGKSTFESLMKEYEELNTIKDLSIKIGKIKKDHNLINFGKEKILKTRPELEHFVMDVIHLLESSHDVVERLFKDTPIYKNQELSAGNLYDNDTVTVPDYIVPYAGNVEGIIFSKDVTLTYRDGDLYYNTTKEETFNSLSEKFFGNTSQAARILGLSEHYKESDRVSDKIYPNNEFIIPNLRLVIRDITWEDLPASLNINPVFSDHIKFVNRDRFDKSVNGPTGFSIVRIPLRYSDDLKFESKLDKYDYVISSAYGRGNNKETEKNIDKFFDDISSFFKRHSEIKKSVILMSKSYSFVPYEIIPPEDARWS